jgi:hypothetical protein
MQVSRALGVRGFFMSAQEPDEKPSQDGASENSAPEGKSEKLGFKDKVSLIASLVALALSLATAFWTTARISEDVSVVVRGPQLAHRVDKANGKVLVDGDASDLVFINTGNRPAVILDVQIGFLTAEGEKSCRDTKSDTRFTTSFKPLVVKDGEIGTTTVKIDSVESLNSPSPKGKTPPSNNSFYVDASVAKKSSIDAVSCLIVELSTPSVAYHRVGVPISTFQMVDTGTAFNPTEAEGRNLPQHLYTRFGTIFLPPTEPSSKETAKAKSS